MNRTSAILLAALCLAAPAALAQHWEFEQVDTAPWGAGVQMRRLTDGRLFLCYGSDSGDIRLAWKDSVWHYEDVPTDFGPYPPGSQGFDVGPRGEVGVTYIHDWMARLLRRTETGWVECNGTGQQVGPGASVPVRFNTAGEPSYMQGVPNGLVLARLVDSTWVVDTVVSGGHFDCWGLDIDEQDQERALVWFDWDLPTYTGLELYSRRGSVWTRTTVAAGRLLGLDAGSLALTDEGEPGACWWGAGEESSGFYYVAEKIDTTRTRESALAFDSLDRPQVAYGQQDGLHFGIKLPGGTWWKCLVDTHSVAALDLVLSDSMQPIIGHARTNGVWLAHGVDIVGVEEPAPAPEGTSCRIPTVVRGILNLQPAIYNLQSAMVLLDASGRRVLKLHPGPNDISHLSPGVYFVCPKGSRGRGSEGPSTKVVIQR